MTGRTLRWTSAMWAFVGAGAAFAISGWGGLAVARWFPGGLWWPTWAVDIVGTFLSLGCAGTCMVMAFRSGGWYPGVKAAATPPPYIGRAHWVETTPGMWEAEFVPPPSVPAGMGFHVNLPLMPPLGGPVDWFDVFAEYRPVTAADREERPYGRCGE